MNDNTNFSNEDVSLEGLDLTSSKDIYNQEDSVFKEEGKAQKLVREVEQSALDDPFRFLRSRSYQIANIIEKTNPSSVELTVEDDILNRLVDTKLTGMSSISGRELDNTSGGGLSNRLLMSADDLAAKIERSKRGRDYQLKTGFHSRETMSFYTSLLDNQYTEFGASYFQMQNIEFAGSFYKRAKNDSNFKYQVSIQSPSNISNATGLNILLGNRLMSSTSKLLGRDTSSDYVQEAMFLGSFHPKIGYVSGSSGQKLAWIGTQNITPVGSTKATIEPVFLVGASKGLVNKVLYKELKALTATINTLVKNKNGDYLLTGDVTEAYRNNTFIKVGNDIFNNLAEVINIAALDSSSRDKVFMSMSEINMFISPSSSSFSDNSLLNNNVTKFKKNVLKIAQEGRLQLTIDQSKIDTALGKIYEVTRRVEQETLRDKSTNIDRYDTLKALYSERVTLADLENLSSTNNVMLRAFKDKGDSIANNIINNSKDMSVQEAAAIRAQYQEAEVYTYLLFKYLGESNGLVGALATNLHDKSVAIVRDTYSENRQLQFYQLGSANLSAAALLPYEDLSFVAREEVRKKLERKYGKERADQIITILKQQNQPLNLEAVMQIGRDVYSGVNSPFNNNDVNKNAIDNILNNWMEEEQDTPDSIKRGGFRQKQLEHHLNSLSNSFMFNTKGTYQLSYKAEAPQSSRYGQGLGKLEPLFTVQEQKRIEQITYLKNVLSDGGTNPYINVEYRFDTTLDRPGFIQKTSPIGLRVTIGTPDRAFQLKTDLTVNSQGQVIFTDLNKVINGALYVNASNDVQRIKTIDDNGNPAFALIDKMESRVLTPLETAVGLVNTMQRVMLYQQEHALVDSIYSDYMNTNPFKAMRNISDMIATKIKGIHNQLNISQDSLESTNLVSVLNYFITGDLSADPRGFNSTMDALENIFVSKFNSRSIEPGDSSKRKQALKPLFSRIKTVFSSYVQRVQMGRVTGEYAATSLAEMFQREFLQLLAQEDSSHLDYIRKELVLLDKEASERYKGAARGQARTILTESLSPFLAAHEETYNYLQGGTRLPVYGESYNFDYLGDSEYTRMMGAGLLNPLPVTHGTYLGQPGKFYRALGSVSYGEPLRLPAYGALRSLSIVDSDISSQASVVHNFEQMQKSTTGMMRITRAKFANTLRDLIANATEDQINAKVDSLFKDLSLDQEEIQEWIHVPFTKVEQITQRVKNVIGMRPALTVQSGLLASMLNFLNVGEEGYRKHNVKPDDASIEFKDMYGAEQKLLTADQILSGRLRTVLPEYQYEALTKDINNLYELSDDPEGINYELLQSYYRTRQLDLLDVEKGFIGPSKLKRVAINQGISLLGDFSYFDYSFNETQGKLHRVRFKLNPNSLDDPIRVKDQVAKLVDQGVIVTSSMYKLDKPTVLSKIVDGQETRETVSYLEPAAYTITEEDGEKVILQVGKYVESGFIEMTGHYKVTDTTQGARLEGIRVKIPAFAKRDESGIALLTGKPSLVYNVRGTLQVEADVMTFYRPSTSSRILGGGFIKGPVVAAAKSLFTLLKDNLDKNDHRLLRPDTVSKDIFAYTSLNVFKGYTYESGMEILAHMNQTTETGSSIKNILTNLSGQELAKSFALLFMGDNAVRSALQQRLKTENNFIAAGALEGFKGVDITKTLKSNQQRLQLLRDAEQVGLINSTESLTISLQDIRDRLNQQADVEEIISKYKSLSDLRTGQVKDVGFTTERDFSPQLMYMATALGMIAESPSESFNIDDLTKGMSLDPMKRLIIEALTDSSKANLLKQRYGQLIELVERTNPRTLKRRSDTGEEYNVRFLNEQSMINRAAGILTHMIYYNQQIFKQFEPSDTKKNFEKIKFDNIGLYVGPNREYTDLDGQRKRGVKEVGGLTHLSYRTTIDSILTQAGVNILLSDQDIEEDTEKFQVFKQYLSVLQGTQNHAVIMENIVDVSFSQSLVASGMKDSVKAEYQFMVGMPNTQMKRFRNYISPDARSGQANSMEEAFYTLIAQSQVNYSGLSTESGNILAYRLGLFAPTNTRNNTALEAAGLSMSFMNPYFMYARALAMSYSKPTGHSSIDLNEPDFLLPSALQQVIDVANSSNILSTDYSEVESYMRMIEVIQEQYKNNIVTNPIGDYLTGLSLIEQELIARRIEQQKTGYTPSNKEQAAVSNMLQAVKNTTQIILPSFEYSLVTQGAPEEVGRFRVNFLDTYKADPTAGVLMGTDILSKIALNFGGHKDEVLLAQNKLMEAMENAKGVLQKISSINVQSQGRFLSLNETELNYLIQYKTALEESRMAMFQLVETEVARQALGDHESLKGVVGIATNSFILNPDEYVVGGRYERVVASTRLDRLINTAIKQHLGLAKGEFSINSTNQLLGMLAGQENILSRVIDNTNSNYIPSMTLQAKEAILNKALGLTGTDTIVAGTKADLETNRILMVASIYAQAFGIDVSDISANNQDFLRIVRQVVEESYVIPFDSEESRVMSWANIIGTGFVDSSFFNPNPERSLANRLAMFGGGTIGRTGQPGGASANITGSLDYKPQSVDDYVRREEALNPEGYLRLDPEGFLTGFIAPSLSSLIAGLGDYDGDSYRLIVAQTHAAAKELLEIQRDVTIISNIDQLKLDYSLAQEPVAIEYHDKLAERRLKDVRRFKLAKRFAGKKKRPRIISALSGKKFLGKGSSNIKFRNVHNQSVQLFRQLRRAEVQKKPNAIQVTKDIINNYLKTQLAQHAVQLNRLNVRNQKAYMRSNYGGLFDAIENIQGISEEHKTILKTLREWWGESDLANNNSTPIDSRNLQEVLTSGTDSLYIRPEDIESLSQTNILKQMETASASSLLSLESIDYKEISSQLTGKTYAPDAEMGFGDFTKEMQQYILEKAEAARSFVSFDDYSYDLKDLFSKLKAGEDVERDDIKVKQYLMSAPLKTINGGQRAQSLDDYITNLVNNESTKTVTERLKEIPFIDTRMKDALGDKTPLADFESVKKQYVKALTDISKGNQIIKLYKTLKALPPTTYDRYFEQPSQVESIMSRTQQASEYIEKFNEEKNAFYTQYKEGENFDVTNLEQAAQRLTNYLAPLTSIETRAVGEDSTIQSEMDTIMDIVSQVEKNRVKEIESKSLDKLKTFIGTYLGLAPKLIEKIAPDRESVGRLVAALQQKYDMSQIDNLRGSGAMNIHNMRSQLSVLLSPQLRPMLSKLAARTQGTTKASILNYISTNRLSTDITGISNVLDFIEQQTANLTIQQAEEKLDSLVQHYIFTSANLASTIDGIGSSIKKAAGIVLNPFEFDAAVQVIGEGGTKLIGEAYNTFIPLLDSLTMQTGLLYGEAGSQEVRDLLSNISQTDNPDLYSAVQKFLDRDSLQAKFSGTVGLLANMQQIVRDALKAKDSDGSLLDLFRTEIVVEGTGETTTFAEALSRHYEALGSPQSHYKAMSGYLGKFLRQQMGPKIALDTTGQGTFLSNEPQNALSTGYKVRGFGAMLMLTDFTRLSQDEMADVFLKESGYGLESIFTKWVEEKNLTNQIDSPDLVNRFLSEYIGNLLIRTQAEFAATNVKEPDFIYNPLKELLRETKNNLDRNGRQNASTLDRLYYDLYDRVNSLLAGGQREDNKFKMQVIAEANRLVLEARREDEGILDYNMFNYLREVNQATMGLTKVFEDDSEGSVAAKYMLGNTLILRQAAAHIQRGKADMAQILFMASNKLNVINKIAAEIGDPAVTTSMEAAEAELKYHVRGMLTPTGLSEDEVNALTNFLMEKQVDDSGKTVFTNLNTFSEASAALASSTSYLRKALDLQEKKANQGLDSYEQTHLDTINLLLSSVISNNELNVDILHQIEGTVDFDRNINRLMEGMAEHLNISYRSQTDDNRLIMRHSAGAEVVGIIAAPLLLALAGSKMKPDERVALFALDVFQGYAELIDTPGSFLNQVVNTQPDEITRGISNSFRGSRLRQAMNTEGIGAGLISGVSQELAYKAAGAMSQSILSGLFANRIRRNPTIGNVGLALATEVLSTVFAQGFTRAMYKRRGFTSRIKENMDMLVLMDKVIEQAWRFAEFIQEQAISSIEVHDAENLAQDMDWTVNAYLSPYESDVLITQIVVVDADQGQDSINFYDSALHETVQTV